MKINATGQQEATTSYKDGNRYWQWMKVKL
jgi:hypothetical protein